MQHARAAAAHAAAGEHAAAVKEADSGLALWPEGPGDDFAVGDPPDELRAACAPAYRELVRTRALSLGRMGRHGEAAPALSAVFAERPRDEEVLLELLKAEQATAGPSEALARYDAYRRQLRDDLGTDPGAALQALHQRLLQGSAPAVRHGVLHEPNPLLGRDHDLAAVADLLHSSRVTSIVGPGGLGKTRLAHAVSRAADLPRVEFVPLAGVRADGDVVGEVASALGVGESLQSPAGYPRHDVVGGLVAALGPGPALLVLDNCEQVIQGVAELVRTLVAMHPNLRVLTTSRAPLGLSSEAVYPLPELDLRTAVELFTQRARAARPGVDLPPEAVAALCLHLDGLPLAVELAAARARVMSVPEIARHLNDRFALLRGAARDAPERHHTLHAVVDWSWNLLDEPGQTAMRLLSVFANGFTVDAATHVIGPGALDVLQELADQSLLKVVETPSGTRFRMLETVREFSSARRESAGETERANDGVLSWARDLAIRHHGSLLGANPADDAALIRAEQDNLVLALRHALAREDSAGVAATTALLGGLWSVEARYSRMLALTDDTAWLLSHFHPGPDLVEVTRSAIAVCAAHELILRGTGASRSMVTLRRLPPAAPGTLIGALSIVLCATPEMRAPEYAVLHELCASDEPLVAGIANAIATYTWENEGGPEPALQAARRMLESFAGLPNSWVQVMALSRVSELSLQLEQGAEALRHLRTALRILEGLGDVTDTMKVRWTMVLGHLQLGEIDQAEHWLELAADDWPEESPGLRTFGVAVRAQILLARGHIDDGLRMLREAAHGVLDDTDPLFHIQPAGIDPWQLEIQAVCVVAHAQHRRLDEVDDLTAGFADALRGLLAVPVDNPQPFYVNLPVCGGLLLALGMVALDRGDASSGVRMIALAQRLHYVKGLQPTMSSARATEAAEKADKPVYEEAMSSYTGLSRRDLREAAVALMGEPVSATDRG